MALKLGGLQNLLFDHSNEYNQGTGHVRRGQSTTVVAKDGTGDFEDIQEAVKSLSWGGGKLFVKEGTYKATDMVFENNITIEGESRNVIIEFDNDTVNNRYVDMSNTSNIYLKNLTLKFKGEPSDWDAIDVFQHINITGSNDIEFDNVVFKNYTEDTSVSGSGYISVFHTDLSSRIKIIDSEATNEDTGNMRAIFYNSGIKKSYFEGNNFGGGDIDLINASNGTGYLLECIVSDNKFGGIFLLFDEMSECTITGNIMKGRVQTGEDETSEKNVINSNHIEDTTTDPPVPLYLGPNSQYNVAVGNVLNDTAGDDGTSNTVANNQSY